MKKLLENADLFAHRLSFNYDKKDRYHSFFGIWLSLLLYAGMIFFVHYFSKDLIHMTNPKINYQENEFTGSKQIPLINIFNFSNRYISYGIISDKPILNISENSCIIRNSSEIGEIQISLTDSADKNTNLMRMNTEAEICNRKKTNSTRTCRGKSSCYRYGVNVKFNENPILIEEKEKFNFNDFNLTIFPLNKIHLKFVFKGILASLLSDNDAYIQSFIVEFDLKNHVINSNENEFFKEIDIPEIFLTGLNLKSNDYEVKRRIYNYEVIEIINDKGFIFSKIEKSTAIKKTFYIDEKYNMDSLANGFLMFEIHIDYLQKNYQRIFKKLQNFFADIGGLLNSLILLGNVIISHFNNIKFNYDIINRVFEVEKEDISISKNNKDLILKQTIELQNKPGSSSSSRLAMNNHSFYNSFIAEDTKNPKLNYSNSLGNLNKLDNKHKPIVDSKKRISDLTNKILAPNDKKDDFMPIGNLGINNENKIDRGLMNLKDFVEKYNGKKLFEKPLKFSKLDFLITFLCCKKLKSKDLIEKEKIYLQAESQIYEYMDVTNYVLLFEKFDKLVSILLNDHQTFSLNFMRKRRINEIDQAKEIKENDIKNLVEYYKEIMRESENNAIDLKLFKGFSTSFSNLIVN